MNDPRPLPRVDPGEKYAARLEEQLIAQLEAGRIEHSRQPNPRGEPDIMLRVSANPETAHRTRRSYAIAAVAAGIAAIGLVGIVIARKGDDGRNAAAPITIPVTFDVLWPDLQGLEAPRCITSTVLYESAQNGGCIRSFDATAELAGDVVGTALWTMAGNVGKAADAADSAVEVPSAFNGTYLIKATIAGCGTGEFMIAEQLRFDGWEAGAFSGTWQVISGSGRGELQSLGGGGVVPGDRADENTTQENRVGELTCPPPPAD